MLFSPRILYDLIIFALIINGELVSHVKKFRAYKDGDIRLVDGEDHLSGTVQVFRSYAWGIVCDDRWTMKEGNVICRQLDMGYAVKVFRNNHFRSSNSDNYLLDDVKCEGNETRLIDCKSSGWGIHNCKRDEHAGVQCVQEMKARKRPSWNPLNLRNLDEEQIKKLEKKDFEIDTAIESQLVGNRTIYPVVVKLKGSQLGPICPDYFGTIEAMLVCKALNLGIGGKAVFIPMDTKNFPAQRHLVIVGRCFGNETSLNDCPHYTASGESTQLPCLNDQAIGVECFTKMADLKPSAEDMMRSAFLSRVRLWHLTCAIEEGCLPESVNTLMERDPHGYVWKTRSLLRFTSIIDNIGTDAFIPYEKMSDWQWHACHMHYHSMQTFAYYNLIDLNKRIIATGHKASFCLEDSDCDRNVDRVFECSNVINNYGTQGISPGCRDSYRHDYDCQWIDITIAPPGNYELQVVYNPDMLVPESNFFNNGLRCSVHYSGHSASVRNCVFMHPLEMT